MILIPRRSAQSFPILAQIPSPIAGLGLGQIGNERALRRAHFVRVSHVFKKWVPLDVEFGFGVRLQEFGYVRHVAGTDVPLIGAGMNGNSMRPGIETDAGGVDDAGDSDGSRVSQRGDFIYVDAELGHRGAF